MPQMTRFYIHTYRTYKHIFTPAEQRLLEAAEGICGGVAGGWELKVALPAGFVGGLLIALTRGRSISLFMHFYIQRSRFVKFNIKRLVVVV